MEGVLGVSASPAVMEYKPSHGNIARHLSFNNIPSAAARFYPVDGRRADRPVRKHFDTVAKLLRRQRSTGRVHHPYYGSHPGNSPALLTSFHFFFITNVLSLFFRYQINEPGFPQASRLINTGNEIWNYPSASLQRLRFPPKRAAQDSHIRSRRARVSRGARGRGGASPPIAELLVLIAEQGGEGSR